jgi:hypothetical protein
MLPKGCGCSILEHAKLKRFGAPVLFIIKRTSNGIVEASRCKIILKASINRLRVVLVEPRIQIRELVRGESGYGAFNFFYRIQLDGGAPRFLFSW